MEGLNFEQSPSAPVVNPSPKRINKRFIYLVISLLLLLVLAFAGFKFLGSKGKSSPPPTPTPTPTETITSTPTPTVTPTPTPSPSKTPTPKPTSNPVDSSTGLDRSTLTVSVQNGSGVAGAAAKASDFLKSLGYDVTSTGNADNENYQNVTIQVKNSKSSFLSLLKSDLSKNYTVGTTSANLSASSSADSLVIIGK